MRDEEGRRMRGQTSEVSYDAGRATMDEGLKDFFF